MVAPQVIGKGQDHLALKIREIAKKHDIHVIEDAAQSFGAEYQFQKAGSFSSVAIFSMNPMKVVGGYGETGAVVTDRKDLYEKLKILRYLGTKSDPAKIITNEAIYVSLNHKIDTIQAAMILVMMKVFSMRTSPFSSGPCGVSTSPRSKILFLLSPALTSRGFG